LNSNTQNKPTTNLKFKQVESTQQLAKMFRIDAFVDAGKKETSQVYDKKETIFEPTKMQAP